MKKAFKLKEEVRRKIAEAEIIIAQFMNGHKSEIIWGHTLACDTGAIIPCDSFPEMKFRNCIVIKIDVHHDLEFVRDTISRIKDEQFETQVQANAAPPPRLM